ncbi:DEAD/DEAH box helicase family protein [Pseudomonas asiatica]|uniref:DEAD/DEAH box helicase family protein n=1 Tax=Pseudomonas asiatica TaxID=2219225 RepID=A0AAJ5LNP4_9PSED|nr:DEAD/DEAH box helicase family protein [Pseudomonas asiatica]UUC21418.1 DEAD/DEAH box helicase family protein [Pseudomonas asiatica]
MQRINQATAASLIDFSAGKQELEQLAVQQLEGTVALHNRLADHRVAYLADEVGMGKTYIALGVAALMRRFNPSLRVLYLLPKNNVRDKWVKDYRSFVEYNYVPRDLSVKGLGNQPVAPYLVCLGLPELIQVVATSSNRDYFICTSAFSFALGNTVADLRASLSQFARLLPQHMEAANKLRAELHDGLSGSEFSKLKNKVKAAWAKALNDILPRFDLVVVDEAHNLKKGRDTSDRNQLLAMLLGADSEHTNRVGRLLLLSATPFDRQLNHLHNQLNLFGLSREAALPSGNDCTSDSAQAALGRLIVRRLNAIELGGKIHTRNMYRQEHRTGTAAEVQMTIEQHLFAALMQKKVSEYLQENCAGRFELGMLASFESYLPGEKNKAIEFDGQDDQPIEGNKRDAQDRHVVESLIDDFNQEFKTTPPHPKMDWVADKTHELSFGKGKKQLIFVRRVRSVSELKFKLERAYDAWLGDYIRSDSAVSHWFDKYSAQVRDRNQALTDEVGEDGEARASSENFFTWFYRGKNAELELGAEQLMQLPFNFRNVLAQNSYMFEPNWATLEGMPSVADCQIQWQEWIHSNGKTKPTPQLRFRLAQYAYLKTVQAQGGVQAKIAAGRILSTAFEGFKAEVDLADLTALHAELERKTFWDVTRSLSELASIAPAWSNETFQLLATQDELVAERAVRRILTHTELLAVACRLDHPFIDLYSLRSARRGDNETDADSNLITGFVELLMKQRSSGAGFSSFQILYDLACNLDLLIKLNFADAYHTSADKLTRYLTAQLNPLSPVSGATGENSTNRSPLARKFRMPGYPRVLISTDVFQEGEDLHTFCDSIQHYGISASPIALEQKVGRVDRIASMAHRRMGSAGELYGQHFIQVGYPHIRESLEFFQVRQAAANLNAFQRSLHRLGDGSATFQQSIDMREQLAKSSAIEPQITEPLESLFKISTEDLIGEDFRSLLQTEQGGVVRRLAHVRSQVEHCLSQLLDDSTTPVRLQETTNGWGWDGNGAVPVAFQVRSAKGLAKLLISATSLAAIDCSYSELHASSRVNWLRELQKTPLVRLQWDSYDSATGAAKLKRNTEVYAGGEEVLISIEVDDIYQRVLGAVAKDNSSSEQWDGIRQKVKALCKVNGRVSICEEADSRLLFTFHHEGRKQPVDWCLSGSHVVFSSVVLDKHKTLALAQAGKSIADCPLITHTLRRNLAFDLVDFHIDKPGQLAVRACHPIAHLNNEELEFIACSVASEADRLEQILLGLVGSN